MRGMPASRGRRIERSTSTGGSPASSSRVSARTPQRRMVPAFPQNVHGMRLRSQTRVITRDEGGSPMHLSYDNRVQSPTFSSNIMASTSMNDSEMRDPSPDHRSSSTFDTLSSTGLSSPEPFEDPEPFLNPSTPPRRTRVWGQPSDIDRNDFEIYEDLFDSSSPEVKTPSSFTYHSDEDKENNHATSSDYEESEPQAEEPTIEAFDYDRMINGQPEMWGPFTIPNVRLPPQGTLRADGSLVRNTTPPVPIRNPVPIPVRFEHDGEEVPQEIWQSILHPSQIRDLRGLNEVLARSEDQRVSMGRQYPMREENSQPSANVLLAARRITSYQRSQARREFIEESDGY